MNVTITIDRVKVLEIVEGLSATIAQHNAGVPTFEQLWASESERKKLDIWWRDAVNDLEDTLKKWISATTAGYDLSTTATDYTVNLDPGDYWSTKLTGLLKNRMQYYFVHAVMAGWLSDFAEVNAPNYTELTANDLKGILNVMNFRELAFDGVERREDTDDKASAEPLPTGESRRGDTDGKADGSQQPTGQRRRGDDEAKGNGAGGIGDAERRREDTEAKGNGAGGIGDAERRREDTEEKAAGSLHDMDLADRERDDLKPYRVGKDLMGDVLYFMN